MPPHDLRQWLAADVDLPNIACVAEQLVLLDQPVGHLIRAAEQQPALRACHMLNRVPRHPLSPMT